MDIKKRITKWIEKTTGWTSPAESSKLRLLATIDPLTGLNNRSKLEDTANEMANRIKRDNYKSDKKQKFFILMIDIDFFKKVNDNYGHIVGDEILKEVSLLIRSNLRPEDKAFRYGGEEILVMAEEKTSKNAFLFAERIRVLIENNIFCEGTHNINLTVSIGYAKLKNSSIKELIEEADGCLYRSKEAGRNQTTPKLV